MLRYAITDRHSLARGMPLQVQTQALQRQAAHLAAAGVDYLQLREKDLVEQDLVAVARSVRDADTRASLLLNVNAMNGTADRWMELVQASGCDGIHIAASRLDACGAGERERLRSAGLTISIGCHSVAEVRAARGVAGLLLFAPVFEKTTAAAEKSSPGVLIREGIGLEMLQEAVVAADGVPVLALGGVTPANTAACMAAGAAGVAGIRLFQASHCV